MARVPCSFVVAPLDVIKIRLQLQSHSLSDPLSSTRPTGAYLSTAATFRHILRHEGIAGFWKGNLPAELMYLCYAAIQFATYRSTAAFLQSSLPVKLPDAAESFIAGAAAGATATTLTYPLDLLRTRFAAQGRRRIYTSLRGAVRDIARDEGYRGFFRGLGPGLAQIMPFMGLFFVIYEGLRARPARSRVLPWGSGEATSGVVASIVAKTAVFPLDLVRRRIQVQGPTRTRYVYNDIPEYSSALRALATIVRTEGFLALYKGLPISLMKAAPASAVTLWTYEQTLGLMMRFDARPESPL